MHVSVAAPIDQPAASEAACRDVRLGGRWSAGQRLKNWLIYLSVRAALAIVDRLPSALLVKLGALVGSLAHATCPALRRRASDNLALALPDLDARVLARRSFVRAGENLAVCLLLRRAGVRARDLVELPADSVAILERALAEGRGVVFVSPHQGPFELVAAAVAELGHRPAVVVRESYDPRFDPIVDRHRVGRGLEVIHRGRPGAAARILRALRERRIVGFLPDLAGRVRRQTVPFLGAPRAFAVGPQQIADRARAPLLAGLLERDGRRFSLRIERIEGSGATEMTLCVASAFDRAIRAEPEDWLWMAASSPGAP